MSDWFEEAKRVVNNNTPLKEASVDIGGPENMQAIDDNVIPQPPEVRQGLVNSYYALEEAVLGRVETVVATNSGNKGSEKKRGKVWVVLTIIEAVLLISLIGYVAFIMPSLVSERQADEQNRVSLALEGIQARINVVYADASKTALMEGYSNAILDDIYLDIAELPEGTDISGIVAEMNTISKFYTDDVFLKKLEDDLYNLSSDFVISACNYVQTDMLTYSVSGLQSSMKSRINALLNERVLYYKLLSELQVTDSATFDSEVYTEKAGSITHTYNRVELLALIGSLNATKESKQRSAELADVKTANSGDDVSEEAQKAIAEAQKAYDMAKANATKAKAGYLEAKEGSQKALISQVLIEVLPSGNSNEGNTEDDVEDTIGSGEQDTDISEGTAENDVISGTEYENNVGTSKVLATYETKSFVGGLGLKRGKHSRKLR